MKKFILPAFILMVLVQWIIPSQMIWSRERILSNGKEFRFMTRPVDPVSPFQGRYVKLNYAADTFRVSSLLDLNSGDRVYVELGIDKNGFAEVRNVSKDIPKHGADYVEATVSYASSIIEGIHNTHMQYVHINYPFDEYYMDEYKAQDVERILNSMDSVRRCFAVVRVSNGKAVIKDLSVNDRSIHDYYKGQ